MNLMDAESVRVKVNAINPRIIVEDIFGKPYYSIMWYDIDSKEHNIGYSSYDLSIVRKYMDDYFNVVSNCTEMTPVKHGHNISECNPVDEFICSNCGLIMRDFSQIRTDEDDEYEYCCEFEFSYCPKCGYRITEEGENANTCNM